MNLVKADEQLLLLKSMTVRTGSIHEAQILQLKMWPRMIKEVTSAEVRVDVENQTVTTLCKAENYKASNFNKKFLKEMCKWTRMILWDKTKVVVKMNGKAVFNSDNP